MSSNAAKPQSWFHNWRSTPRPAPDTDPADLGTAFGLDLSMSEAAPLPPASVDTRPGWVQRLAERRRSAT
jgi:hypothetical protein